MKRYRGTPLDMFEEKSAVSQAGKQKRQEEEKRQEERRQLAEKIFEMIKPDITEQELDQAAFLNSYLDFERYVANIWGSRLEANTLECVRKLLYSETRRHAGMSDAQIRINDEDILESVQQRVLLAFLDHHDWVRGFKLFTNSK